MWLRFKLARALSSAAAAAFVALGGPRVDRGGTEIRAPLNCAWLVANGLKSIACPFEIVGGTLDAPPVAAAEEVLSVTGLRPLARDFLSCTAYQMRGLCKIWNYRSGALFYPTGCLAGDTQLVINRGGASKKIRLDRLVAKFNGQAMPVRSKGNRLYAWDLTTPTYAQSMTPDGFIRLNRITAAVESGVKEVFALRTMSGHEIAATADHRFWTPNGWARLGELRAGDAVFFAEEPRAGFETRKLKAYYLQIAQMWNHPHAVIGEGIRTGARTGTTERVARVPLHRLEKEAEVNGISLPELVGRIVLNRLDGLKFLDPASVHVHHRDENTLNNARENLEILPIVEHHAHHGREDGWKHLTARAIETRVATIERVGEAPTYDLSMEAPNHNFVANGLVVHNSGKSLMSFAWALKATVPTIVVTRGGNKRQMRDEIYRFVDAEVAMLEGKTADGSAIDVTKPPRFIVTGWEILGAQLGVLRQLMPMAVILDESHRGKSGERWKGSVRADGGVEFDLRGNMASAVYELSRLSSRTLLTTATPIANGRIDLWAQLDLMEPDAWGKRKHFGFRYTAAEKLEHGTEHAWKPGRDINTEELNHRLYDYSGVALVSPAEVAKDLPPKRRIVSYVTAAEQVKVAGFARALKQAESEGGETATEFKLLLAAAKKRAWAVKRVGEYLAGKMKLLVFTGRVADAEELYRQLTVKYEGVRGWLVTGQNSMEERYAVQQEYMGDGTREPFPGPCYIVCTHEAMGESLNLQDTDVLLNVMLPWTPKTLTQVEGRGYRQGMRRPFLCEYAVAEGTYDEHVAEALIHKLPSVERVMGESSLHGLAEGLEGDDDPAALTDSLVAKICAVNMDSLNDMERE